MLLAEFTVDHPFLYETFEELPDAEFVWEQTDTVAGDASSALGWVENVGAAAFEAAVTDDPTVSDWTHQASVDDRHLYRLVFAGTDEETSVYPIRVEVGGVNQRLVASADGWRFRTVFPSLSAFQTFRSFCTDHDLEFEVHTVYTQQAGESEGYGLTAAQHETLVTAVELGYFEIPRETDIAGLADELDVSANAVSERLRRATGRLVESTLKVDE